MKKIAKIIGLWSIALFVAILAFGLTAGSNPVNAADGDLDPTFGGDGRVLTNFHGRGDVGNAVAIQANGEIVVAGSATTTDNHGILALARYQADGTLIGTYERDLGGARAWAEAVALDPDGNILVGGVFHVEGVVQGENFLLARFLPNGEIDYSFGDDGFVTTEFDDGSDVIKAIAVQDDGSIVAAGFSCPGDCTSGNNFAVARYLSNGGLDTSFSGDGKLLTDLGGEDRASALALQPDGKIVVAGISLNNEHLNPDFALVRYLPGGTPDPAFSGDGQLVVDLGANEDLEDIVIQPDGKIVAAGASDLPSPSAYPDFLVARFLTDGSLDNTFSGDGYVITDFYGLSDVASAVDLQVDGKIVVAGMGTRLEGEIHRFEFGLVRYLSDGTLDATLSGDGKLTTSFGNIASRAEDLAIQPDGKILLAGNANPTGPYNDDFALARYLSGDMPIVQVEDEDGNPVQDAEVYRDSVLLGRTDSNGVVALPAPQLNQHIIARTLVYTGTTPKANHDGWQYHVWLTNVTQENNGNQTAYTITDTNRITQTVVLKRENAQIGLNIVGSVNYLATTSNLADIAAGLEKASEYLFDVTDGQMFMEKFTLYEDNQNFADADIQFSPWEWPSADPSGILNSTGHLYMPGPGFNDDEYKGGWQQPDGFRTLVHEFGHYAIGARDEYRVQEGEPGSAQCTLDFTSVPESRRASIMHRQFESTEFCADDNHNPATEQGQTLHESVWATFVRNWGDAGSNPRWTLRTPMSRGVVNPGPSSLLVINDLDATIVVSPGAVCDPPIFATVYWDDNGNITHLDGAAIFLTHGNQIIYEGETGFGGLPIYGATTGDVITTTVTLSTQPGVLFAASATISNCSDSIELELQPISGGPSHSNAPSAFNTYWLTSKLNRALGTVTLSVHFDGEPSSAPSVSLSQDGGAAQPVSLTYDPATYTYSGSISYDPARALRFLASAGVDTPSGNVVSAYTLSGAEYQASGPFIGDGVQQIPLTLPPPEWWGIFPSEDMVSLSVNATSMADGTGVMVADTDMPPGTPPNLLAVGGPYSIEGDNPITGQVGASLNFQAELFCGLESESIAVYWYDPIGGTWTALPTDLNEDWNQAYVNLTQWGIYAVFAQPNTVPTFSDVPSDSTFFDYVQWMACHRIASGYTDGTFRVGNNATRGQISKMVALAYSWNLEPPESESQDMFDWRTPHVVYTFADVPPDHTFYLHIEAAYGMGVFGGYPCGSEAEPCDDQNRPYFRPGNNATRGQIAKILSNASIFNEPAVGQTFEDVPPTHTFYQYVERMSSRGIIGGYPCGAEGEPCGGGNRPYFRPGNNATRGQLSKMIYLTLQPR